MVEARGPAAARADRHRRAARHRAERARPLQRDHALRHGRPPARGGPQPVRARGRGRPRRARSSTRRRERFDRWLGTLDVVPTIAALRERAEAIVEQVLRENESRWESLSEADRERVGAMARAIVNRLLHEPTLRLKGERGRLRAPARAARAVRPRARAARAARRPRSPSSSRAAAGAGEIRLGTRGSALALAQARARWPSCSTTRSSWSRSRRRATAARGGRQVALRQGDRGGAARRRGRPGRALGQGRAGGAAGRAGDRGRAGAGRRARRAVRGRVARRARRPGRSSAPAACGGAPSCSRCGPTSRFARCAATWTRVCGSWPREARRPRAGRRRARAAGARRRGRRRCAELVPAAGPGLPGAGGPRRTTRAAAELAAAVTDRDALVCLTAERALVQALDATCHTPVGAHATLDGERAAPRAPSSACPTAAPGCATRSTARPPRRPRWARRWPSGCSPPAPPSCSARPRPPPRTEPQATPIGHTSRVEPGTVYLVGAGPGDPGLMTRRALELIAAADAILYDRLIPAGALDGARADAELRLRGQAPGRPVAAAGGDQRAAGRARRGRARRWCGSRAATRSCSAAAARRPRRWPRRASRSRSCRA